MPAGGPPVTRGRGHIPDYADVVAGDLRARHVGRLLGVALRTPAVVDYAERLDRVLDQGTTASCVGQALSTSLYLRGQIACTPVARPSPLAIYTLARLADAPHATLTDDGSRPASAVAGLRDHGLVAEPRWPLVVGHVDSPLPLDVYQHGGDAPLLDHYRIASGPGASVLVRQALARGFAPCLALQIDRSFEDYAGGRWDGPEAPIVGGHYVCAVGYGEDHVWLVNSWGTGWGLGGLARIADRVLDDPFVCSDLLVPTVTPTEVT